MSYINAPGSGGGGGGTITEGSTPTSGFTDGYALISSGDLVEEASIRIVLQANSTINVSTTGSDALTVQQYLLGSPALTLQHVMDVVSSSIDTSGFQIKWNVGAGSFAGFGVKSVVGGGSIFISGAGVSSTTITAGPNDGTYNFGECVSFFFETGVNWYFSYLTIAGSSDNNVASCMDIQGNQVTLGDPDLNNIGAVNFSSSVSDIAHIFVAAFQLLQDSANIGGAFNCSVSGSSFAFLKCDESGFIDFDGAYTVTSTPAFSVGFIWVRAVANVRFAGSVTGSATGPRAFVQTNGVLRTGNQGATFLPGNSPVQIQSGGIYDASDGDTPVTVANLPTAVFPGTFAMVSDSTVAASAATGATVIGGGSNTVAVYTPDGINWYIVSNNSGSGGGSPGGSSGDIQYNNSGSFGGASGVTTDGVGTLDVSVEYTFAGTAAIFADPSNRNWFFGAAGPPSGISAVTATDCLGFGNGALWANGFGTLSGNFNTAMGSNTLFNNIDGSENTGVGFQTLPSNVSGSQNTGVGSLALNSCTGNRNTGVGAHALENNNSGDYNTAVGAAALENNQGGNQNTAVGENAGASIVSGQYNTIVGVNVDPGADVTGVIMLGTGDGVCQIDYNLSHSGLVTIKSGTGLALGNAYVATPIVPTGYLILYDSNGVAYKIPAVAA